jgi:hypothetical protein
MRYESTLLASSTPDLTDQPFDRLTVLTFAGYIVYPSGGRIAYWTCQCSCGRIKDVAAAMLTSGHTRSCGCLRAEVTSRRVRVHGKSQTAEHRVWRHMLGRCENPTDDAYARYGGRGITVCEQWHDFSTFYADVGPRPSSTHTLDRYPNNNGNYEPGNVRWATRLEQGQNKRNNRFLTLGDSTQCVAEWARITGLDRDIIVARINNGWSDEKALTTPLRQLLAYCKNGHPMFGANLLMQQHKSGRIRRVCRRCRNDRVIAFQKRHAKRDTHMLTYKGETKLLSVWAHEYGLTYDTVYKRLYVRHMTAEEALTTPRGQ